MSKSKGEHVQAVQMATATLIKRPDLQPEKVKNLFVKLGKLKPEVDSADSKIKEAQAAMQAAYEKRSMLMGSFETIMELISDTLTDDELLEIIKVAEVSVKPETEKSDGLPGQPAK